MHHEKLAAGGVGCHGACHGENALFVAQVIFKAVGGELTLDAVAGAAGTGACGVTALNHKTADDAVKDQAVIKSLLNEGDKVIYRVGSDFRIQFCLENAAVFHFKCYDGVAHGFNSSFL